MEQQNDQTGNLANDGQNDPNASNEVADGRSSTRKEQFTKKQRLDMYAFCVLELETHSNTVSIKKRQQAIKKALSKGQVRIEKQEKPDPGPQVQTNDARPAMAEHDQPITVNLPQPTSASLITPPVTNPVINTTQMVAIRPIGQPAAQTCTEIVPLTEEMARQLRQQGALVRRLDGGDMPVMTDDEKTLEQLQQEISSNMNCYSDYQRTQVLTSGMLKNVQVRFAKYYPNSVVPSRTTIKHVFDKCVAHGTVDNIRNPRKPSKITKGIEIEQLLLDEPHLSLRQLAVRLNVSVGTISRRCKSLGLIPESVTLKHQQLAIARRKQMKRDRDITPTKDSAPKVGRPAKGTPNGRNRRNNGSDLR